tara:strand:- start:6679 stop:7383 length:705 start_codon:yes stop_codon:yes gene_type:complete
MNEFRSFYDKSTGWFFLDFEPWSLYLRIPSAFKFPISSHCHQDYGSPVIDHYYNEVIIDPGRSSYMPESNHQLSAEAHSTILINGEQIFPSERDLPNFPTFFSKLKFKFYYLGNSIHIFIRFPISIANKFKIKYAIRFICISSKSIEIIDRIKFIRNSSVYSSYNFPSVLPNLNIKYICSVDYQTPNVIPISDNSTYLKKIERAKNYCNVSNSNIFTFTSKVSDCFNSQLCITI